VTSTAGPGPTAPGALLEAYDLAMLDLDGVVYVGGEAVPGAPAHLAAAREAGLPLAFITNNASRAPTTVAQHLTDLGVPADATDVVTSAQAASRVLHDRLGDDAPVAVLGATGLRDALEAVGLTPVDVGDESARAVVTGYGPDVLWSQVMQAAVLVRDGLWWVASNTDATIPTDYGVAPGHGVLVDTLRRFSGVDPVVAGKPARPLLDETVQRMGCDRPVMVGDRLDTDIAGARALGLDSLLVMTGVTGVAELAGAVPDLRPTHVGADLGALLGPPSRPEESGGSWQLDGWRARVASGGLQIDGEGDATSWWRVAAAAAWAHLDATGDPAATDGLEAPGAG